MPVNVTMPFTAVTRNEDLTHYRFYEILNGSVKSYGVVSDKYRLDTDNES